jgi:hypothetical protein
MQNLAIWSASLMKPRPPKETKNDDLFRARLTQIINTHHELVQLADKIDWTHIDQQVQPFFATDSLSLYDLPAYFKKHVSIIG